MSLKRLIPCLLAVTLLTPGVAQNTPVEPDEPVALEDPATKVLDQPVAEKKKSPEGDNNAAADMMANMPPEAQAGMQRWMVYKTPNVAHAELAKLVGEWDMDYSVSMGPGQTARMPMKGKATFSMILGGRYLQQDVVIDMGQMGTMKGLGILGYNIRKQQLESIWLDEGTTWMMISKSAEGVEPGDHAPTMGTFYDPYLDQESETRSAVTMNADGTMTFTIDVYQTRDDSWWDMLKITYARVK